MYDGIARVFPIYLVIYVHKNVFQERAYVPLKLLFLIGIWKQCFPQCNRWEEHDAFFETCLGLTFDIGTVQG